jgi:pyruvate dehydrogenase E1 component alpha subunit
MCGENMTTATIDSKQDLSTERLLLMYQKMVLIREFEQESIRLYREGLIRGYFHPYIGQEAIAVGVCEALLPQDYIVSTHRGHGHCIASGGDPGKMMAELFGRETGYCRGRGGSMHIANLEDGNLGANGIVGGGIPLAVGAALAALQRGTTQVAITFFSDGATNNGVFHESLNIASIWKLPVVFVCENNLYAVSTPISQACLISDLAKRADSYCMPGIIVDGNDVLSVYSKAQEAVQRARSRHGPTLIEAKTYRHTGHHVNDPGLYRPKEEMEKWKGLDPIVRFRDFLENRGILATDIKQVEEKVTVRLQRAIEFANDSPVPSLDEFIKEVED